MTAATIKSLVQDLMLAQHGRTAVETLTADTYQSWNRGYVFDAMRDQRYGQSFCNHFGITDYQLWYERDVDRARELIRRRYLP